MALAWVSLALVGGAVDLHRWNTEQNHPPHNALVFVVVTWCPPTQKNVLKIKVNWTLLTISF